MTLASVDVQQTTRELAMVRGQGSHQTMQAIDQDHPRNHLNFTTVKYVKLAVPVLRYDAC